MVRKGIPESRAKKGIIPSNDPFKDRARTVHMLVNRYSSRIAEDKKSLNEISKKSTEILEIGGSDRIFDGKDPYISGIAVFIAVCRYFSYDCKCPITYDEIRDDFGHFASGSNFVGLLKELSAKFKL